MQWSRAERNTGAVAGHDDLHDLVMVDDDGDALAELAEALAHRGLVPTVFTKPAEAVAHLLRRPRPVVVVADVCMPGMTGLDLTRRLRAAPGDTPAEVILISANSGMGEAIQAVQAGAFDFLVKPVDPGELAATIGRAAAKIAEWRAQHEQRSQLADLVTVMVEKARDLLGDTRPGAPRPRPHLQALPSAGDGTPMPAPQDPARQLSLIKLLQGIRRSRDRLFECCADGDADWEILLFVREQEVLGRPVSVTSACHAASIPQTTAMRKIDELIERGFLARHPDPSDRRRVLVHTTARCAEATERYLETVGHQIASAAQLMQ